MLEHAHIITYPYPRLDQKSPKIGLKIHLKLTYMCFENSIFCLLTLQNSDSEWSSVGPTDYLFSWC